MIARFVKEDNVYKDGLNLYAYCKNNPLMYVNPSGHATTSAANKVPDLTPDQQAVRDIVDEVNRNGGSTPSDEAIIHD